jgi:GDP-fucose transporter C1
MSEKHRPEYTRVAMDEKRLLDDDVAASAAPAPASKRMVVGSLGFSLVAALVMVMVNSESCSARVLGRTANPSAEWVLNQVQIPMFFLFVQLVIAVFLLVR